MSVTERRFILVGHDITGNCTGRLLSMSDVASELGETYAFAFGAGEVWRGSSQFTTKITRLGNSWQQTITEVVEKDVERETYLWISKGVSPTDKVVKFIAKRFPKVKIILDIDDDDRSLAEEFTRASLINAIKLNPARRGSSQRIAMSLSRIQKFADGYTFSTDSLASSIFGDKQPYARIPHVRNLDPQANFNAINAKSFGCFGTIRPHKGGSLLVDFMRSNRDWRMVTFENCGLEPRRTSDTNWLEIPSDTPLDEAYDLINVALIPIVSLSSGAQFQLPAKIVDAMKAGKAIVASSTPAIKEILENNFVSLPQGASLDLVRSSLETALQSNFGMYSRKRFESILTPEAASKNLDTFIRSL